MSKENIYHIKKNSFNRGTFSIDSEEYISTQDSFISIDNQNSLNTVNEDSIDYNDHFIKLIQDNQESLEKEAFYIKAIKNLIKQKEYINLLYQVSNELISEKEFDDELNENESKYLININEKLNSKKLRLITHIVNNLNENLSEDDLSELFSIRTNSIESIIKTINYQDESSLQ